MVGQVVVTRADPIIITCTCQLRTSQWGRQRISLLHCVNTLLLGAAGQRCAEPRKFGPQFHQEQCVVSQTCCRTYTCHEQECTAVWTCFNYISREWLYAYTTRNVYWWRASVCLSLATFPHYCTDPDV